MRVFAFVFLCVLWVFRHFALTAGAVQETSYWPGYLVRNLIQIFWSPVRTSGTYGSWCVSSASFTCCNHDRCRLWNGTFSLRPFEIALVASLFKTKVARFPSFASFPKVFSMFWSYSEHIIIVSIMITRLDYFLCICVSDIIP